MVEVCQNNKINLLKALAIMIVLAGHLEFSLIPMFPPYSFQVLLFFFISGMLYNPKYTFFEYLKRRIKSLLIPYFLYELIYIVITTLATPIVGKFWGMKLSLYNELVLPFLTGHQLDLISPLWFVPCLFITLIAYKILNYIKCPNMIKLAFYSILALLAIHLQKYSSNIYLLWILRTMFALLFVHLGFLYKNFINNKVNIFTYKIFGIVILIQSLLWLTNQDFTAQDGIGLHFLLVWGEYNNWIVPIITSITGIWMSLFIIEILYDKIKDCKFLSKVGQNTMHIMANHLLIFNIITYIFLAIKGIPFDIKNSSDIYWFYCPLKTTYFYFIISLVVSVFISEVIKLAKNYIGGFRNENSK